MVRIRTGTEACPYGAAPPRSVGLPSCLHENQPPLPPLNRGARKNKSPSTSGGRRFFILPDKGAFFFAPLLRGGRGGCLYPLRRGLSNNPERRAIDPGNVCLYTSHILFIQSEASFPGFRKAGFPVARVSRRLCVSWRNTRRPSNVSRIAPMTNAHKTFLRNRQRREH